MKQIKTYLTVIVLLICIEKFSNIKADELINISDEKIVEKPKMFFEEQLYDFGKIYIGEHVKHGFKFKNVGLGELIINSVKSSCGCTAALVTKNKLIKNEEGEVEIRFNPGNYVGKVTKSVIVNSNDPENPKYTITITGEIIEEVGVNPKRINFGIMRKGDTCTKILEIKTVPEAKIEIKKVESPSTYITITQNKSGENNKYNYQVTMSKYDYIGKFDGIVFVYTSSNKQERIDVPFCGEIVGDVTFYPEKLALGNIKKNQEIKKAIIINFVNKDTIIEKIEVDPNVINYTVSELNNSSKKIDVKLGNGIEIGKITGSLKIYTNSIIQPIITIPIIGEIKG